MYGGCVGVLIYLYEFGSKCLDFGFLIDFGVS